MGMRKLSYVAYELHPSPVETAETAHGCSEPGVKTVDLQYPVVRRERFGARGTHIPYIFLIQWGAKELLGVSQPFVSWGRLYINGHDSGTELEVPTMFLRPM